MNRNLQLVLMLLGAGLILWPMGLIYYYGYMILWKIPFTPNQPLLWCALFSLIVGQFLLMKRW